MLLNGKTVLVTGGSRGIGAGVAKYLSSLGARVAITYTSRPDGAESVLNSLEGSGHISVKLNLNEESSITEAFENVLSNFEFLDGVVNNAGITKDQILLRLKTEDFDDVIRTNLRGTFIVTKLAVKSMLKRRSGSIVNITSIIGHTGNSGQCNYAASKAGIEGFSKSIAQEVASRNIRVNCVAPGYIETEMTDILNEQQKKTILDSIPMGKIGSANDVAQSVAFLVSDLSNYMTGQTLHVNGGMYM